MGTADKQRRVCVVGSLNMDLVVRAPRFPAAGETILGGEFATFPGGKGANQTVAAARMGAKVSMIGRVGDDAYGEELRRVLEAEGIDTSAVLTTPGTPTGVAVITVAEGGGNTIVVAPGANGKVTPSDVEAARQKIEEADVLLMQLEVPLETVEAAAAIAKASGKVTVLNAAPARTLPHELLSLLEVLIVNETEAAIVAAGALPNTELCTVRALAEGEDASVTPEREPATQEILDRVAGLSVSNIVVTFGENGSAWVRDAWALMYGAYRVEPVDTVGAGDAFCGTLAATWPLAPLPDFPAPRETRSHEQGVRLTSLRETPSSRAAGASILHASAAGALATTRRGAIPALPRIAEVTQLLDRSFR